MVIGPLAMLILIAVVYLGFCAVLILAFCQAAKEGDQ